MAGAKGEQKIRVQLGIRSGRYRDHSWKQKKQVSLTGNKGGSWGQWSAGFLPATLLVVTSSQKIDL